MSSGRRRTNLLIDETYAVGSNFAKLAATGTGYALDTAFIDRDTDLGITYAAGDVLAAVPVGLAVPETIPNLTAPWLCELALYLLCHFLAPCFLSWGTSPSLII